MGCDRSRDPIGQEGPEPPGPSRVDEGCLRARYQRTMVLGAQHQGERELKGSSGRSWSEDGCPTEGQGTTAAASPKPRYAARHSGWSERPLTWEHHPPDMLVPHPAPTGIARDPAQPPMVFDVPGSQAIPDGVPLGWEAPWENPHKMMVEEEVRMILVPRGRRVSPLILTQRRQVGNRLQIDSDREGSDGTDAIGRR